MNPIMRKSGLTPDQIMRRQLYSLLEECPINTGSVNIIGNNIATDESSDLVRMIRENGFELKDITLCKTYQDYLRMAESAVNISYNPIAKAGGDVLEKRLGQNHLYLPFMLRLQGNSTASGSTSQIFGYTETGLYACY